jgi:8-oxo-dGTP pyrophosphatase MutT (NUDIX family)
MSSLLKFDSILEQAIREEIEPEFKSAVAIVRQRDRWLLGLSRETGDDRTGKWVHPGGGIKHKENPKKAAERECFEETGIRCRAVGEPFRLPDHKGVAFVPCTVSSTNQKIDLNHEFSAAGFFTMAELRTLKPLYKNAQKLIERVRNR